MRPSSSAIRPILTSLRPLPLSRPVVSSRLPHVSRTPIRSFQNILAPNPDSEDKPNLAINKLTPRGFILSDNLVVPGGCIFHSGRAVLWDVDPPLAGEGKIDAMWSGWGVERFRVFEVVVPRPGKFILGGNLGPNIGRGERDSIVVLACGFE
uniref:Uncharacterized protein n=1 Tax=Kwoniella bestiolae CBS 10118 TaxID=1296100 RepID=A0A1B9FU64_9TREE|nr:hypothetical protein I302_07966 [Kwoniella bestiolae CBS 10118]OCF22319.1 hypothetical protein I302_07966 [Kwoniella bestiolae CBS 10118]